jgi:hypothetical protein
LDATNLHSGAKSTSDTSSLTSSLSLSASHFAPHLANREADAQAETDTDVTETEISTDGEEEEAEGTIGVSGKHKDLYKLLLTAFGHISKKSSKKLDYDALAVVNVAPSVVPNPYLPSFRIYAYNLSGSAYVPARGHVWEESGYGDEESARGGYIGEHIDGHDHEHERDDDATAAAAEEEDKDREENLELDEDEIDEEEEEEEESYPSPLHMSSAPSREERDSRVEVRRHLGDYVDRESWCPEGRQSWACMLTEHWHSSPRSPSRTNRLLTPLGFAQVSWFTWRGRCVCVRLCCLAAFWNGARGMDTFNCYVNLFPSLEWD